MKTACLSDHARLLYLTGNSVGSVIHIMFWERETVGQSKNRPIKPKPYALVEIWEDLVWWNFHLAYQRARWCCYQIDCHVSNPLELHTCIGDDCARVTMPVIICDWATQWHVNSVPNVSWREICELHVISDGLRLKGWFKSIPNNERELYSPLRSQRRRGS
jgi:hypothetical protein